MAPLPEPLRLKVQQVERVCLFELSWGRGQQLNAMVPCSPVLSGLYQEWRRIYLSFYETAQIPLPAPVVSEEARTGMRGRLVESGSIAPPQVDWHARLVEAETKLLYEFHRWLRSAELFEIRARIAVESRKVLNQEQPTLDLFLTCTPLDMARLPWEAWEIGTEFGSTAAIRIVRTPANIRAETVHRSSHRKARILAILGDDTGLNFQVDQDAVRALSKRAEIHFVGWQPGQTATDVKHKIREAIAHPTGWDILFFAGHSNETTMTGGELAIAPGTSLRISEIATQLAIAKERGLQFAIFNSCSGLSLAESLIDLGLSQVAVMREPIHNRVAQEFLVHFLNGLAEYKDVHDALLAACHYLKLEKNFTYPSAYLLPSLFRHPDATLFRLKPFGWKQRIQAAIPTRWEAIALAATVSLSLFSPMQSFLMDRRIWVQAMYRDLTDQVPEDTAPPVLLVQIDPASISRAPELYRPNPIDQGYLARLITQITDRGATIVGIDYALDRPDPEKAGQLSQAIQQAVDQHQTWFVFASGTAMTTGEPFQVSPEFAAPEWSLNGSTNAFPTLVRLPKTSTACYELCPFSYLLALIHAVQHDPLIADHPRPQSSNTAPLKDALLDTIQPPAPYPAPYNETVEFLQQIQAHPLSNWTAEVTQLWHEWFKQRWMRPIIDFSIPSDHAYERLSAWRLLEDDGQLVLPDLSQQVVIIASGGYKEAGIGAQADYFPLPSAMRYWRDRNPHPDQAERPTVYTGAEALSYMVHHLLTQHLVVPIPDLWMVGIAVLLGKGAVLWFRHQQRQQPWSTQRHHHYVTGLAAATLLYGAAGLQLYLSAAVLLPWFLPSVAFWVYVLPGLRRKANV